VSVDEGPMRRQQHSPS